VLEEDFRRLPAILGRPAVEPVPSAVPQLAPVAAEPAVQLGLF
jgi:hypothetical protein